MNATEFAKLLYVDGIGQVLATLIEDEEGDPCLRVRIPDANDCQRELTLKLGQDGQDRDYDRQEAYARACFNGLSAENAADVVRPLLVVSSRLAVQS